MSDGKIVINVGALKKALEENGARMIPFGEMKTLNPVAALIKKGLGKDFFAINASRSSRNGEDKLEMMVFPKKPGYFSVPNKPMSFKTSDCLISIFKYPGENNLRIKVNSRVGEARYNQKAVKKARAVVESALKDRGIGFTMDEYKYYKHNGLKIKSVVVDGGILYGNYNHKPQAFKVLGEIPQHRYMVFNTGRRRDLSMKYHR